MALSHAIMTALVDEELSGYELTKRFEVSLGFFWQASHQQIYRTLKQLLTSGYVSLREVAQSGKPDKKLYQLTELGRNTLLDWVDGTEPAWQTRDELFVKLYNLGQAHDDAIVRDVRTRRSQHETRLALYEKIRARSYADPAALSAAGRGRYLSLLAGIHRETAGLAWCETALAMITDGMGGKGGVDDDGTDPTGSG